MTPTRKRIRELAERRELWVEVCEPEIDAPIVIRAEPERALEACHHPDAYVSSSLRRPGITASRRSLV
jgi:hypothetical protein